MLHERKIHVAKLKKHTHMKKLFYIIYILIVVSGASSCKKFLDRTPLNEPTDATFLTNQKEMDLAIVGCYQKLKLEWESLPFYFAFDYISDIGFDRNVNSLTPIAQGSHDATNLLVKDFWTNLYQGVAYCNYLIENMPRGKDNVPQDYYLRINAEARFLRALYYHYIIELWGDAPFNDKVLKLSEAKLGRKSKKEIAAFLIKDLNEAAPNLPKENDPLSGRATMGAAYGLASRIALYNEMWKESADAAAKVMAMEGSQYVLSDDYEGLFMYRGENSKERIFIRPYSRSAFMVNRFYSVFASRNAGGFTNKKPPIQLADSYECTDGKSIDKSPLFDPKNPYKNRDPRLGYSLAVSGSVFLGYQYETHGDSVKCWNYRGGSPVRVDNLEATHAYATFTGVGWRKYTDIKDAPDMNNGELNAILMRYAEILLNYAEAKTELNEIDASVLAAFNKVRTRPGVNMPPVTTTNQQELRKAIRRERKYEFAGEGLRLFDIRRWKLSEEVMNMPVYGRMKKKNYDFAPRIDENATPHYDNFPIAQNGESSDYKMRVVQLRSYKTRDYLWPIPDIEIQTNEGALKQNPGY